MQHYTTPQVCELTGVRKTTLSYWARRGYCAPSGQRSKGKQGVAMLWTAEDVRFVALLAAFRSAGIPMRWSWRAAAEACKVSGSL